jgi:hypothetical protein
MALWNKPIGQLADSGKTSAASGGDAKLLGRPGMGSFHSQLHSQFINLPASFEIFFVLGFGGVALQGVHLLLI